MSISTRRPQASRVFGSLLALASAAATVVAVADSVGLFRRYGGGRASEVGFAWLLHLVSLKIEHDPFTLLPAPFVSFHEFGDWRQFAAFLVPAVVFNLLLAWIVAAVLGPAALAVSRIPVHRDAQSVFQWSRTFRLPLWFLFLSPLALHAFCDSVMIGLGLHDYINRLLLGAALLAAVWLLFHLVVAKTNLLRGASQWAAAAGLLLLAAVVSVGLLIRSIPSGATPTPAVTSSSAQPDVILISIDSLRADHLHSYGYSRETSPHLDALAAEGALFRRAVSPTSWTLPAHASLLTSLPPTSHHVNADLTRLGSAAVTLAEVFRGAGYQTAAFVSAPYLRAEHGFPQGFDLYNDYSAVSLVRNAQTAVTSPILVRMARSWLENARGSEPRRPLFLFLHMWDVHFDYMPPSPYDTMFDPDYTGAITSENFESSPRIHAGMDPRDLQHIIALYDGEIRSTDHHLGQLFSYLRESGTLDKTVIAVTADHGDEFFEHHNKGHRNSLYDEVLLVPWILRYPPKVPAGRIVERQVRLVDVAPTLLSLAGVPRPHDFGLSSEESLYRGRDVSPLLGPTPDAFPPLLAFGDLEYRLASVHDQDRKLIINVHGDPAPELYDVANDPGEHHNLSALETGTVDRLYGEIKAFRKIGESRTVSEPLQIEPDELFVLRSLGYLK